VNFTCLTSYKPSESGSKNLIYATDTNRCLRELCEDHQVGKDLVGKELLRYEN
jgi:hypothetical protein